MSEAMYEKHFEEYMEKLDKKFDEAKAEFMLTLRKRMKQGYKDYKNTSFYRPFNELLEELEQEMLDIPGWTMILFYKTKCMREVAEEMKSNEKVDVRPPTDIDHENQSLRCPSCLLGQPMGKDNCKYCGHNLVGGM
jgi:hypothetical protein